MNAPFLPPVPFTAWLDIQRRRQDGIGLLAVAVAMDTRMPRGASPDAVRARLRSVHAEYEMLRAVDMAEQEWRFSSRF